MFEEIKLGYVSGVLDCAWFMLNEFEKKDYCSSLIGELVVKQVVRDEELIEIARSKDLPEKFIKLLIGVIGDNQ